MPNSDTSADSRVDSFCAISLWTFKAWPSAANEWPLGRKLDRILEAGFDRVVGPASLHPGLGRELRSRGMRFAGQVQIRKADEADEAIAIELDAGEGPVNCQLGAHDTTLDEALDLMDHVSEAAGRVGATVVFEEHRNTAFETPEKTAAILNAFAERGRPMPLLNFDYSHPAVVKHLLPEEFRERLLIHADYLRNSPLLHLRPFNGQHAQLPVTAQGGGLAPEFLSYMAFAQEVLKVFCAGIGEKWIVPELGPAAPPGYGLSCFPDVVSDAFVLAREIREAVRKFVSETHAGRS